MDSQIYIASRGQGHPALVSSFVCANDVRDDYWYIFFSLLFFLGECKDMLEISIPPL